MERRAAVEQASKNDDTACMHRMPGKKEATWASERKYLQNIDLSKYQHFPHNVLYSLGFW